MLRRTRDSRLRTQGRGCHDDDHVAVPDVSVRDCSRARAMCSPAFSPGADVTSKRSTHFTLVKQAPLGTSSRHGAPWAAASGRPFISSQRKMVGESFKATGMM